MRVDLDEKRGLLVSRSEIEDAIFDAGRLPVHLPDMPEPGDLFTQPVREGFESMPSQLFNRLHDAWMSHISKGTVVRVYDEGDHKRLFDIKHQKPDQS